MVIPVIKSFIYWLLNFQKRNIDYFHFENEEFFTAQKPSMKNYKAIAAKRKLSRKVAEIAKMHFGWFRRKLRIYLLGINIFNHVVKMRFTLPWEFNLQVELFAFWNVVVTLDYAKITLKMQCLLLLFMVKNTPNNKSVIRFRGLEKGLEAFLTLRDTFLGQNWCKSETKLLPLVWCILVALWEAPNPPNMR